MDSLTVFHQCADTQKKLFYRHFLNNNKVGEITCVNGLENEDSYLFERFEVNGVGFIVVFRLVSEDSMISEGISYRERAVEDFVALKRNEIRKKYDEFLERLRVEGKTLAQAAEEVQKAGGDPAMVDYKEFTREQLEDTMAPGRRRINGDRNTRIQILYRQTEIPNDLQRAGLEVFELPMPEAVMDLLVTLQEEDRISWKKENLVDNDVRDDLGCHLPFLKGSVDVHPSIYRFPEKELDVSRVAGIA